MATDLDRLLRPDSIAIVGGSWAHNVVEQCQKAGYAGKLWPVHPTHESIHQVKCYPSIDSLPGPPDAVFIGVNRRTTIELVAQLSRSGAGGAVCFASGFSESSAEDVDGVNLELELLEAAGSMPIIGPNCYGFINYLDGALLWPDQHGARRVVSGVALLTQSSNIAINLTMQTRGLPIAYVLTAGNQAQLSMGELALAALEDERVTALGLHIEGFGDLRSFEAMAKRARALGKPVVAIKTGRSEQARRAMVSHTNSLSGDDVASDVLLNRLGIARVNSLSVLIETLKVMHVVGVMSDRSIQSMSCSGGEAGLMADAVVGTDLYYPELAEDQVSRLRAVLGPMVALANPLDYHTFIWNDEQRMYDTFHAILQRSTGLSILVLDFPRLDRCDQAGWDIALEVLGSAQKATGARAAILATLPENLPESIACELIDCGIIPLCGIQDSFSALQAAYVAGKALVDDSDLLIPTSVASVTGFDGTVADAVIIDEKTARELLHRSDISFPEVRFFESLKTLEAGLEQLQESLVFPVVLKGLGIAHKTEAAAVAVNLTSQNAILRAAHGMTSVTGFQLEEFIDDGVAELLISVVRDPGIGFLFTVAAGGTNTELQRDKAHLLLPFTREAAENALNTLTVKRLLEGYRGRPSANLESVLDTIMKLQNWSIEHADRLSEIEINPLICGPERVVAVDVLITMTGARNE